jgi:RNA polymerase sigma factor (TIGR02999 family)
MEDEKRSEVTRILHELRAADADRPEVTARAFELLYAELRSLAAALFRSERAGHTLQPTALVHEAFARLVDRERADWQGSAHFLGIAGQAMRRVLVDHARARGAAKRGGERDRVTLSAVPGVDGVGFELIELDDALTKLARESGRAARVAELKVFAGLSGDEIAEVLGVSRRTVTGDWTVARLWLARELGGPGA